MERTHQLMTRRCFIAKKKKKPACFSWIYAIKDQGRNPEDHSAHLFTSVCWILACAWIWLLSQIMVVDGGCWILAKTQRPLLHSVSVRSHPETGCFWWPAERVGGAVGCCGQEDWGLARRGVCKSYPVKTEEAGTVWWEEKSAASVCSVRGPDVAGEHTVI